jgi:hypothetical protein
MKNIIKTLAALIMPGFARACTMLCIGTITLPIAIGTINFSTAQTPPPPNGGGSPGSGNTPVGGGAPIAGGIGILLALGAAYGGKKVYNFHLANRLDKKRKPAE